MQYTLFRHVNNRQYKILQTFCAEEAKKYFNQLTHETVRLNNNVTYSLKEEVFNINNLSLEYQY